jgi:hypothetical protein
MVGAELAPPEPPRCKRLDFLEFAVRAILLSRNIINLAQHTGEYWTNVHLSCDINAPYYPIIMHQCKDWAKTKRVIIFCFLFF